MTTIAQLRSMIRNARDGTLEGLPPLPDKAVNKAQRALQAKHGTPYEFAHKCCNAIGEISVSEARNAIERYRQKWEQARKEQKP